MPLDEKEIQKLLELRHAGRLSPAGIEALEEILGKKPQAPQLTFAQKMIRGAAPSVAGGIIGGGIGSLIAPGPGTVAGTALGSAAGEAVTQYFDPLKAGIEEPSPTQIGLAGALPIVPTAIRRGAMALPGAAAGLQEFLLKRLGDTGDRLIAMFAPIPGTASQLFQRSSLLGKPINIPLSKFKDAADIISKETKASWFSLPALRRLGKATEKAIERDIIPFEEFRANQSILGRIVRSAEARGGVEYGDAKLLYKSMWQDLNEALKTAPKELKETLSKAIDSYKREEAADIFKNYFLGARFYRTGQAVLDVDSLMTKITRNRDVLVELMPSNEIDDIMKILKPYSKIPVPVRMEKMGIESVPFSQRMIIGGGAGAAIGLVGGGAGEAVAGGLGSILAVEAVSTALTTKPGRAMIRLFMEQGMTIDQIGNLLLQNLRAGISAPQTTPTVGP